jgi:hypothetical protein
MRKENDEIGRECQDNGENLRVKVMKNDKVTT